MSSFSIQITPAIPSAATLRLEFPDQNYRWQKIVSVIPERLQLAYIYDGVKFGYHPADIVATLNDLSGELAALREGQSHYVSVSGYNVAYARCISQRVWFLDIPRDFGAEDSLELKGSGISLEDAQSAFQASASAVWDYIAVKVGNDKGTAKPS